MKELYSLVFEGKDGGKLWWNLDTGGWQSNFNKDCVCDNRRKLESIAKERGGRVSFWIEAPTEPEPEPPAFAKWYDAQGVWWKLDYGDGIHFLAWRKIPAGARWLAFDGDECGVFAYCVPETASTNIWRPRVDYIDRAPAALRPYWAESLIELPSDWYKKYMSEVINE